VLTVARSSPYDREIVRLAVPALGALMAEPVYVLTDTAIVGHLGTAQLGGLAVAGAVLLTGYALFVFLAYATTASVARLQGAGRGEEAARQGVQGCWLALAIALPLTAAGLLAAGALVTALGAGPGTAAHPYALLYLRISLLGAPAMLLTYAGTGYLRGLQDTRTPLVVAAGTAAGNLVLEVVLVYGLGYGVGASAAATVVAQYSGAVVYLWRVGADARRRGVPLRPSAGAVRSLAVVGGHLLVRTAALRGSLLLATAVATRLGPVPLAAHAVAFEIWSALALGLDALAIAAQALVGRMLGAGDEAGARAVSRRLLEWGVLGGVLAGLAVVALRPVLPGVFTGDARVAALTAFLLLVVAAVQPLNAVVFVLDGVLIGAGDARFLAWSMSAVALGYACVALLVPVLGLGIGALWGALVVLMLGRAGTLCVRFRGAAWTGPRD
jgi:putative MATE family efflux protein